jgi:ribosomal 50S subunit-recycling heat shock protein
MRLDKYLKVSRLIKRRTVAKEACDAGKVYVNGNQARASYEVKISDKIDLHFGGKITSVKVTNISQTVRKEDASTMYV